MKHTITATNTLGEQSRLNEQQKISSSQSQQALHQTIGVITKVHESKPWVKVSRYGHLLFGGRWVLLNHSVLDILGMWGSVRQGMSVLVTSMGPAGDKANATIIGLEEEFEANKDFIPQEVNLGFHRIFAPGMGI